MRRVRDAIVAERSPGDGASDAWSAADALARRAPWRDWMRSIVLPYLRDSSPIGERSAARFAVNTKRSIRLAPTLSNWDRFCRSGSATARLNLGGAPRRWSLRALTRDLRVASFSFGDALRWCVSDPRRGGPRKAVR